ncbi:Bug family tripartite tricarboxylate transporter substrate binding protein [Halalkalibacter krulwichiae]|uniref:Tripartite tricarboxylate transporter family receptor n=1 Tax=Halalkalibacter krulwichiae TaxID=199441 RepID=A0A1X9MH52_9BACI|nr:hypothetical protein [Halalkalibacter krulwichiae]ARK29762.1 hypothetical protein BkAM31D_07740 [Halalkalibacter krulwichiae]
MIFKRKQFFLVILLAVTFVLSACTSNESGGRDSDVFYQGQNIEMLVPFGAGGGTDVFARFLAPYISEHIEGNPTVQPLNVPGGGSITGTNEFYRSKEANGFNILATSGSTHTPYLLKESAVQYDLAKLTPIIGFASGGVVYTTPELKENLQNEQLVYAGISATGLDLLSLLAFEVLELDVQSVLGYEGRGPSRVAFEQGESTIDYQTSSAYLTNVEPLVDEGMAAPLFSFGQLSNGEIVRDPVFPELPSIKEYYEELYGKEPSGPAWESYKTFVGSAFTLQKMIFTHEDAPQEAIDALVTGFTNLMDDESFFIDGEEVLGGYEPYLGEELDSVFEDSFVNVSEENIDWVINFLKENYGVTIE